MLLKITQGVHRMAGMVMALFILLSTVTGYALLHRESFSIEESLVKNGVMQWAYGPPRTFNIDDEVVEEDYPPTWEKALTRFHRGDFFGKKSTVLMDLVVLALVALSLSGPYLWYKRRQLKKRALLEERLEDLDYLTILEQFRRLKGKESDINDRIVELHDNIEHLFDHTREGGRIEAVELIEITEHIRELDRKTHEIMGRLEKR